MSTSQFRQTFICNFATDIDVGQLNIFWFQSKQKNRKPEPAVDTHFRKVFLSFYFLNYLVVIKPSGSTVNSGLSASVPSGLM